MPDSSSSISVTLLFLLPRTSEDRRRMPGRAELDRFTKLFDYVQSYSFRAVTRSRRVQPEAPNRPASFPRSSILALSYERWGSTTTRWRSSKTKELRGSPPRHETRRSLGQLYAYRPELVRRAGASQLDEWSGIDRESLFSQSGLRRARLKDKDFLGAGDVAADWEEAARPAH